MSKEARNCDLELTPEEKKFGELVAMLSKHGFAEGLTASAVASPGGVEVEEAVAADWRPERLFRTCLSSLEDSTTSRRTRLPWRGPAQLPGRRESSGRASFRGLPQMSNGLGQFLFRQAA